MFVHVCPALCLPNYWLKFVQGICGYPIEKHALFVMTIMPALRLLKQDSDDDFVNCIIKRTEALRCYLHSYFSSPMGKRAICYGLTWLIMRLCFGGACDTSLASLADDDHSLIYMLNMCFSSGVDAFPALPHPDGHFCTGQEMVRCSAQIQHSTVFSLLWLTVYLLSVCFGSLDSYY